MLTLRFGMYQKGDSPYFVIPPDQWLLGQKESSNPSTPSPELVDSPPSFPMDMLAVPTSRLWLHAVPRKTTSLPQSLTSLRLAFFRVPLHAITAPADTPTSTRIAVASEFLTWSQIPPARRQGGNLADMSSRNPSSLRRPAPSHYMIGDPLTRMHEPDPTRAEVDAFAKLVRTSEWKEMRKDLDKWAGSRTGATFEAKGNPSAVTNWDNMMSTYFSENVIINSSSPGPLSYSDI